ncbi:hypothetical protein A2976_03915 [candidate division WWE3 bacterium RIFCSPLOWO2_01_FULL_41_9]|uniref:Glycosidase n=3 Tax=Katanobacteria TaxID=422282 RepID=A0A1F4VN46_UNCKA|nr:MAG: hypothetical protein A2976_03915 [candidate division WWE3 bacterium RIFCSPLOWO2_01_FULL_41_9]
MHSCSLSGIKEVNVMLDTPNSKTYFEHPGKVIEVNNKFKLVMAIALDPTTRHKEGIVRCVISREGDLEISGYIDRSELHIIKGDSLEHFVIGERLKMRNEDEVIKQFAGDGWDLIGLEDPDIFIDKTTSLTHIYFTIPFLIKSKGLTSVNLGHAVGPNLNSLEMTMPVLLADEKNVCAKEVSIAPTNKLGVRYNLVESNDHVDNIWFSTVRVAIAKDLGKSWKFGETVFHPNEHKIPWIAGHASPGPLLPKTFIDPGHGKMLGIINGREANQIIGKDIKYGMFSVGLFIYDYEKGKIDWVSPDPLIQDSQAKTITFASQFVGTTEGEGILYAHVDDSFVRAYTLYAGGIRLLLPI